MSVELETSEFHLNGEHSMKIVCVLVVSVVVAQPTSFMPCAPLEMTEIMND